MSDLIFHHFDQSPYSEKIRLIFGLKGLTWNSVQIPRIMPKPDFVALTGGYRQTPALQIGADIYCDTQRIVHELEKRHPEPTVYTGGTGINEALAAWTDSKLFRPAVRYIFGTYADNLPIELLADRERMNGRDLDVDSIKESAIPLLSQAHPQLAWIEDMLADGRHYLLGTSPALSDFAAYHCVWFMNNTPKGAEQLQAYSRLTAWMDRVKTIGHGTRVEMDAKKAIETAKNSPVSVRETPFIGTGPALGSQVSVSNEMNIPEPVIGELVISSTEEIAIRRFSEEAAEIIVHFPRLGYYASPA